MTLREHVKLAPRTNATLGSKIMDECHMALGMTSELNELITAIENKDKSNILEEIGDIHWYWSVEVNLLPFSDIDTVIQQVFLHMNIYSSQIMDNILNDTTRLESESKVINIKNYIYTELHKEISLFSNIIKRELAYKKIDNEGKLVSLAKMQYLIYAFCVLHNINIDRVRQVNIDKLRARYPDKFTEEKALNRDLDKEKEIIDGKNSNN